MIALRQDVPLAPETTFELGGSAAFLCDATRVDEVVAALAHAAQRGLRVAVLAGGSNTLVPDAGFDGLVLRPLLRGIELVDDGPDTVRVRVAAGEPWDDVVRTTVEAGLSGLECLSGIPGHAGATPIQNVGAYGVEVADVLVDVEAVRRADGALVHLAPEALGFSYRDSALKRDPSRYVVTAISMRLRRGTAARSRHAELAARVPDDATPQAVREAVLALRRGKSMVYDRADPNHRSAGSFFTNPIVAQALADEANRRARALGLVPEAGQIPSWPEAGRVKLSAGWLVERSGFPKGHVVGRVGLSTQHALCVVHHGGGTTEALLAFAATIQQAVSARFGVGLEREPVVLGADGTPHPSG